MKRILYIGGSPCSGKSTAAERVRRECEADGIPCLVTDGTRTEDETYAAVFGL